MEFGRQLVTQIDNSLDSMQYDGCVSLKVTVKTGQESSFCNAASKTIYKAPCRRATRVRGVSSTGTQA